MSNNTTTTTGFLKNQIDITHKPKRYQSEMLKTIEEIVPEEERVLGDRDVPKTVTLERAIKYFEANAEGDKAKLFKQTSEWLKDILTKKV